MTDLESMLKSRKITLLTMVHIVKARFFPVVMYACESWTIKKAERQRIEAFELSCRTRLLSESTDLDLFNSIIIFSLKTVLSKSSGLGDETWGWL